MLIWNQEDHYEFSYEWWEIVQFEIPATFRGKKVKPAVSWLMESLLTLVTKEITTNGQGWHIGEWKKSTDQTPQPYQTTRYVEPFWDLNLNILTLTPKNNPRDSDQVGPEKKPVAGAEIPTSNWWSWD